MNASGLYTLAEMREMVRRKVDTIRPDTIVNGEESGTAILDPILTNQDINLFLNTAVVQRSIDMNLADDDILADTEYLDVVNGVTEYAIPDDAIVLRSLQWKWSWQTFQVDPPLDLFTQERSPMHMVDDSNGPLVDYNGVPTWRRRLNFIVLNATPDADNQGGIKVEYIKWLLPLVVDDQVLETQFARVLQELIIMDAAVEAAVDKLKIDASLLVAKQAEVEKRFIGVLQNSTMPRSVNMVPVRPIVRQRRGLW